MLKSLANYQASRSSSTAPQHGIHIHSSTGKTSIARKVEQEPFLRLGLRLVADICVADSRDLGRGAGASCFRGFIWPKEKPWHPVTSLDPCGVDYLNRLDVKLHHPEGRGFLNMEDALSAGL